MNLGPHADFIVASYVISTAIVVALIAWVWLDHRAQRRALHELNERGIARRSGRNT